MRNRLFVTRLLLSSAAVGIPAGQASAQTAAPVVTAAATPTPAADEIIVTGSLFRGSRVTTVNPITTLSAESLKTAGITTIADAVRSISADNSGTIPTAFGNGFAAGSSGVALRGLTVNSTLVLIDGLRTANYALADDGQRGFVDLNTIPVSLIDRIEVLKDGASSTYGADAIGGVVNIIMKRSFTGIDATAEGGIAQKGGGGSDHFNLTIGTGDLATKNFNVYANFEYQHDDRIGVSQRGFPFNTTDLSSIGGNNQIGGQPGQFSGSIYGSVTPGTLSNPADITSGVPNDGAVAQVLRPGGCGPLGTRTTDATDTYCAQNFARYNDDQPQQTRMGFTTRFTAQLGDDVQAYLSASYYGNKVVVRAAPHQIETSVPNNTFSIALPVLLNSGKLNPNNPFASAGQVALINYAFGDIPAGSEENNHVLRGVLGLQGTFRDWKYDVAAVAAHTWLDTTNRGYLNFSQLISDVNSGTYNFLDPSQNSAAVRSALAPDLTKRSTSDLDMVQFSVARSVVDLRGGPLNVGVGGSFRYEETNDPDLNPNLAAQGLGIAHTVGSHYVTSGYFEVDAPILKQIDVNVSGRFDHYTDAGNRFSPKVGVKLTPIEQVILRGTYSQGFRAPSFSENGNSASEGFVTETLPAGFVAAHGGNGYVQPYQLGLLTTANPNVKPELSYSYTLGGVVKPVRWASLSVDYYNIRKTRVIAQADPFAALDAYFNGQPIPAGSTITLDAPDPQNPGALARPLVVGAPYINANSLLTDGLDVDLAVNFTPLDGLKVTSEVEFTDIFRYKFNIGGRVTDYVGTQSPYAISSGAGTPKYRGRWENTFAYGPATIGVTAYYVSAIKLYALDFAPGCFSTNTTTGANFPANCRQNEFIDVDLTGDYKVNDKVNVFFNVLNLMGARPPLDPINYAATNYNPTFSQAGIIGRFFKIGVHVKI